MSDFLHPSIELQYPLLNDDQREAISQIDGPLLIIAGPGSGKTFVLVLRALNILLSGRCQPKEMVLCTFTEKAAFELRDRIHQATRAIGYTGDLSQLKVSTIHSLANNYITRYRLFTGWGSGAEVLDDLTQPLFLFENFDEIVGLVEDGERYLGHWATRWTAIKGLIDFFNKITEELVSPEALIADNDPFLSAIGQAYLRYEQKLKGLNRLDFAHQQKIFLDLLLNPEVGPKIQAEACYVLVDEYQDTNYIQEQLLLCLATPQSNLCVVGDDDQSLYRFRGATVRNILEFGRNFEPCPQVWLETNYRSHQAIISGYNRFMAGCDWSNPRGAHSFRYAKTIEPDPQIEHPDYPSVFQIWGETEQDEAKRLADLVSFLKQSEVIQDYNQVAVLLHSVREKHSGAYIQALKQHGIPVFAPRARTYFNNLEVRLIVACFAVLFGWYRDKRGDLWGHGLADLAEYVDECFKIMVKQGVAYQHPLALYLQKKVNEIANLQPGQNLDDRLADYFYHILAFAPFTEFLKDENSARNLATFSQLLAIFQHYYHYSVITHKNQAFIRLHFFNSFLRFLFLGGINEYEDPDRPFPPGYVQMMTIHQSKGLEFPVVVVGSLDKNIPSSKQVDRLLSPYFHREPFEPENRITGFDRMRLHYVAFSRPQKLLVLTSTGTPKAHFNPIWQGLPQWPHVQKEVLGAQRFEPKVHLPPKKSLSFTSHIKVYEACPRQYQLFREYEFAPSRTAEMFFGSLVHQTIEDIHKWVLEEKPLMEIEADIDTMFSANFRNLVNSGLRPISEKQSEIAHQQILNYFAQNQDRMSQVIETEVDVSVEKEQYILSGRIDLLLGEDNRLELLDFKAQPRPQKEGRWLATYHQQLLVYAHILEQRYGKNPDRLALYWTGEKNRDQALMFFSYEPEKVDQAGKYFDRVAQQILSRDFKVRQKPERKTCSECDFRNYCIHQGTIESL
jgi:DNA helicase II / ATP-dependent DNA helicase PcrA